MDKEFYINQYRNLKSQLGRIPKIREFYEIEGVTKRTLAKTFGNNPYSKLQEACGDTPNKLNLERTPTEFIYKQFGTVTRKLGKLPTQADWDHFDCKPTVSGIERPPHSIKWKDLPIQFYEFANSNESWNDVIRILRSNISDLSRPQSKPKNSEFEECISKINVWIPQRKRFSEEGYKIELRAHLQNVNLQVAEEKGESNIDLLVNGTIAVELKKDPSTSEYDRLFGQVARHFKHHKYVVVVICDISNEDRYRQFLNTVDFIYSKLKLNLKIIAK